jgi:large subunit ribosomal protein L24
VQTTLLTVAIALILALVAALVGPMMVDWGRFRPAIEVEASRLIGAPVRVTGSIEASILPTPSLTLRELEIGPSHAATSVHVRSLGVELKLGALVRGEWRASELHLAGPQFNLGIDGSGDLALPPITPGFDPDRLSIEKLNIEDGHAVLTDSRNGSRTTLEKIWFNGDLRSLLGPFRGEGAFVVGGDLYAYRVAAGRAEQGALKLRLNIDPVEKPLAVDADGVLSFAGTAPRFEGAVTFTRPAGLALPSGRTLTSDPWRFTSKVKATPASALFEAIEFQYGPDERAVRLTGTAELKFGDKPRFDGVLSAAQIDLDRAFPSATPGKPLPLAALKTLSNSFVGGGLRPSIPARIGISVEALTLAGANIQSFRGDLRSDGEAWNLDGFELRAPGFTQINLSGRLELASDRIGFTGPVSVDSTDPTALVAWLEGKSAASATRMKPFRGRGDLTLGNERIAIDRLTAEIDRKWVEGRFAYVWAAGDKPARLDADLNAADLDIDALLAFADAARGSTTFEIPREVTLGLGIGRAVVAGVEASNISARLRQDATGIHVERLSIGDFGGNSLEANGQIDATGKPPQGTLNLRLDARNLAGAVKLAERFAPDAADWTRRLARYLPQAEIDTTLILEQSGAARLALDGRSADLRIVLRADTAPGSIAAIDDLQRLAASKLRLEASVESNKGPALVDLLNLQKVVAADAARPGKLTLAATGPLDKLQLEGRLAAGGLDAAVKGTANLRGDEPKAGLRLTVANADARPLRRGGGRAADPLPVSLTGNLAITGHSIALGDFSGTFAGVPAHGKLAFDFSDTTQVSGSVEADSVDTSTMLAALVGLPAAVDKGAWPAEPFGPGVIDGAEGSVELRIARATLTPTLTLNQLRGALKLNGSEIAVTDIGGAIAGGQVKGEVIFRKRPDGLAANAHLRLTNADAVQLLGGEGKPAVTGRVGLQIDVEGVGLSPQTLVGSLSGNGLVSLSRGEFAALNPKVFQSATHAVDQGVALDMTKIADVAGRALENGALAIPSAEAVVTIGHGQVRLTNLVTRAQGADLTVTGSADLVEQTVNARLTLSSNDGGAKAASDRPVVSVYLNGPISSPKRSADVSALTAWLTLRAVEHQSKQLEAIEAQRRAAISARPQEEKIPAKPAPAALPSQPPAEAHQATAPITITPGVAAPILTPPSSSVAPTLAPPLPPAIEVPNLPNISEQKPAHPPARPQRGTAAQPPRPVPPRPLPLLPSGPHD